jgi:DNA-binding transcriptional ArsR family regulator
MKDILRISRALSDPNRLRLLCALAPGERCVCELHELVGLAPSTVSRHLAILAGAGLVDFRKEGRWAFYRLTGSEAPHPCRQAIQWVLAHLEHIPLIEDDRRRMAACCRPGATESESSCPTPDSVSSSSAPATVAAARWPKGGPAR